MNLDGTTLKTNAKSIVKNILSRVYFTTNDVALMWLVSANVRDFGALLNRVMRINTSMLTSLF